MIASGCGFDEREKRSLYSTTDLRNDICNDIKRDGEGVSALPIGDCILLELQIVFRIIPPT
jgi:hypothetical protein